MDAAAKRRKADRACVEAARAGDNKAYEELMQRYRKSVYYLVLKMVRTPEDAEDLTQESFAKAFSSLDSYDDHFAFTTWLFRIATNTSIDFIRRKKLDKISLNQASASDDGSFELQIKDTGLMPIELIIREQRREITQMAIAKLPVRYRELIELRYFQELSYEEVAEKLQLPLGTVKAQLFRARELMNNILREIQQSM